MSKKFLTGLRLANLTSDPASGSEGELYYNTVTDKLRLYSDGQWIDVVAASSGSVFNTDIIAYPDYVSFDTSPENASSEVGTLFWDSGEGLLTAQITSNIDINIGETQVSKVHNAETDTLNKGEIVYLFGASGQRPSVKRAYNTGDSTSAKTFGIVEESISSGSEGFIITGGVAKNLDTDLYNPGDVLWLGSSPGTVTTTKPQAPNHSVFVGIVVKKSENAGRIFIQIQNGFEIEELHNVRITSPSDKDLLVYNSASSVWVNEELPVNFVPQLLMGGM